MINKDLPFLCKINPFLEGLFGRIPPPQKATEGRAITHTPRVTSVPLWGNPFYPLRGYGTRKNQMQQ